MARVVQRLGSKRGDDPETGRGPRARKRWRFRARGLIGLSVAVVILLNFYILADNAVRLIKLRRAQQGLSREVQELRERNLALQQHREYMQSDEFVRDSAHELGYVAPGESATAPAEEILPGQEPPKPRRSKPAPPY